MHALLRRLFAPRWQHPDPKVRRQALDQLDPQHADQRDALQALADDPQPDIQRLALVRLDDLETLVERFARHRDEPAWFDAARDGLTGRVGKADLRTRRELIERLDHPGLAGEVALNGDNLELRLAALARLDDENDLIHQACHNGVAGVRQQAAQRVESEQGLKRLLKEARRDRQVARLARDALAKLRHDAEWYERQAARRHELLVKIEQHANAPWEPLYGGRLRHLEREWRTLDQSPSPEQESRFHQAILRAHKTHSDHETQEQVRQARQARRSEADSTREQLLEGLEESIEGLYHAETLTSQDIDSLNAQRRLLGQRWQSLSDVHAPAEASQTRFTAALAASERVMEAWQRWQTHQKAIEGAVTQHDIATLSELAPRCAWPDGLARPALLQRARQLLTLDRTREAQQTPPLEMLETELDTLEHLIERGAFKSASRLHQRLKPTFEALTEPAGKPLKARLRQLGAQLAELRDWRGFVAGPKREQLCASIEALAADPHMAESARDRRHRQLIKEWSSLGDAAASRELSARFRAASERIHQRLAGWHQAQDEERRTNLRHREALCEQLETLCDQPSEHADPDALREIRDKAHHQWRTYAPVPREASEAIGRRFGKARYRLQALIDTRAEQIAADKRTLIDEAQALLESHGAPLGERIERTKALQRRWRSLGRAPKGEEQALWKHFKAACDRLFAQRDADQHAQAAKRQQTLDTLQALIDEMDAWQPRQASDTATLDAFLGRAAALEPLPHNRRSEGMQRRLSGVVRARRDRLSRLEAADVIHRWHALRALVKAHLDADQATLDSEPAATVAPDDALPTGLFAAAHQRRNAARQQASPPDEAALQDALARLRVHLSLLALGSVSPRDEPLRLAIQVERLNDGLGGERTQAEEIERVLAELLALGPMPRALWEHEADEFDRLLARLSRPLGV